MSAALIIIAVFAAIVAIWPRISVAAFLIAFFLAVTSISILNDPAPDWAEIGFSTSIAVIFFAGVAALVIWARRAIAARR